jgi:hypothetical protein
MGAPEPTTESAIEPLIEPLIRALAEETARPVAPSIEAARAALLQRFPNAAAILFYGSCLRSTEDPPDGLMDFYVLADSYADLHGRKLARLANRWLPPNVYYGEMPYRGRTLRWKTATVTLAQFAEGMRPDAASAQFWVRFCQSVRIVFAAHDGARATIFAALAQACMTAVGSVAPLLDRRDDPETLWTRLFQETYRTELRPEPPSRAALIFAADRAHFERITPLTLTALGHDPAAPVADAKAARAACERAWAKRRGTGKTLNLLRLIKAAFTFAGAADYAVYKVEKHTGTRIALKDWQRRHALLAAPTLLWAVWMRGWFRSR